MNTIEILREQIKELKELIALKDKRIKELESNSNKFQPPYIATYTDYITQGTSNKGTRITYTQCRYQECQTTSGCRGHYV